MDRYSGRDADLDSAPKQKMTNVERLGIGNMFVRAAPAEAAPQAEGGAAPQFSRVEVVPSRREVKRTAATLAMPPPPPATKPAPPSASGYQAPPWASQPPAGTRPRAPTADVVLDHPSISRMHAAICFEGLTGAWRVVDLDSAHGTFVDGRAVDKACLPACKNTPAELRKGASLRIAASSRQYQLQAAAPPAHAASHPPSAADLRGNSGAVPPQGDAGSKRARLWGPSGDGSTKAPQPPVGPSQAAAGDEGRFQDLVRPALVTSRPLPDDRRHPERTGGAGIEAGGRGGSSDGAAGLDHRGSGGRGGGASARHGGSRPRQGSPQRSRAHAAAQPLGVTPYTLLPPPRARERQL